MSAQRAIEHLQRVGALLQGRPMSSLGDDDLRELLDLLGRVGRDVDAIAVQASAEVSDRLLHLRLGERTAADAVAVSARVARDEARAWCLVGDAVAERWAISGEQLSPRCPALADALRSGALSVREAGAILHALDRVAPFADEQRLAQVERALVDRAPGLTLRDLERLARRTIDLLDPDGAEPREDLLRLRSGVRVRTLHDGLVRWTVDLHPEAAGFLTAAIDARTAPRRAPRFRPADEVLTHQASIDEVDPRPLAQRRLDALVDLARESLTHDDGLVAGTPVTLLVTIPLDALRTGVGTGEIAGVDEPVSAATVRRLACDAEIIPMILGGPSEPLDEGRAVRLFTTAQRRAMAVRDGGCVWPGCEAPPGWCEAAHLRSWLDGGPTDLDNGVLLCPYHHRRLDHDGWAFERREGDLWLIPPSHVDAWRTPRRAGRVAELV